MRIEDGKNLWEYFEEIKNAPIVLKLIWSVRTDVSEIIERKELSPQLKEEVQKLLNKNAKAISFVTSQMEDFRSKNEKFYENNNYYNHFRTLLALEDTEEKLKFFITDIFSKDNILSFKIRFLENIENIFIYNNQDKMIEDFAKELGNFVKKLN